MSTDIYDIAQSIDTIKAKYIDIPEETLTMGIYGYLSEVLTNATENAAIMAAEYANEAIPTRAKFERNVLSHALSLGISSIRATPANMRVMLCFPRSILDKNLVNDRFVVDKRINIVLGNNTKYIYHLDYDIIIRRSQLPNSKFVYTAMYDMNTVEQNEVSDVTNPYLPAIGVSNVGATEILMVMATIRNISYTPMYRTVIVDNPLESKSLTFDFEDQLAYFNLEVKEGNNNYYLHPVYDGLTDITGKRFCNYLYVNESRIRVTFNRDSYQPRSNATVTVNVYTTKGTECNFSYREDKVIKMQSERFSYDSSMYMIVRPMTDSVDAKDRDTVDEIRRKIPKQMLMRGSVTTIADLNNYFNFLNTKNRRLYFLEKIHNQMHRLYYSYLLLRNSHNNIVPTNTLEVEVARGAFSNINDTNYIIPAGTNFYLNPSTGVCRTVKPNNQNEVLTMDNAGFLYMNPFLMLINKNPFFTGYYLNILNYQKMLNFEYVNDNSEVQLIAGNVKMNRYFYKERDTYTMSLHMEQNIDNDFHLITMDDHENIIDSRIMAYAIIYSGDDPIRFIKGNIVKYTPRIYSYDFEFKFKTNNIINKNNAICITEGMGVVANNINTSAYLPRNIKVKFFILTKLDYEYGRGDVIDKIVPNLNGWTLTNIYGVHTGIDLYYDYTDIMNSYTTLFKNSMNVFDFVIDKVPLIRQTYMNTEERVQEFIDILEKHRRYIAAALIILEDSFGVDFKFFNTYGPSLRFNIDKENLISRVNMTLTFEIKFTLTNDMKILDEITKHIKEYIENINDLSDLHMPNLITSVTNKFRNRVVYFKFIDLNGYGPIKQSIYREDIDEFVEAQTVPEFLNVNTRLNETADIEYKIIQ